MDRYVAVKQAPDLSATSGFPVRPETGYYPWWRCPSTWWAPPPSKRAYGVIHRRRVRFPSTSAKICPPGSHET